MTEKYFSPQRTTADGRAMLNVGCGGRFHPDWTNVDLKAVSPLVIEYNILKNLPFEDNVFDVVYHSHILEHLSRSAGEKLLRECVRVLKPGGIIRVVVPDLAYSCQLYLECLKAVKNSDAKKQALAAENYQWALLNLIDQMVRTQSGGETAPFIRQKILLDIEFMINTAGGTEVKMLRQGIENTKSQSTLSRIKRLTPAKTLRLVSNRINNAAQRLIVGTQHKEIFFRQMGEVHQWMYDSYSLGELLKQTGFSQVNFLTSETSAIIKWDTFYLDIDRDGAVHKPNSLLAEAVKATKS